MQVTESQLQRLERLLVASEEVVKRLRLNKDLMSRPEARAIGDLDAAVVHARLSLSQIVQSSRRGAEPIA